MRIGVDICSNQRIARALSRSQVWRDSVFSPAEIAYCEQQSHPEQHFGARWAAKEACLKAVGVSVLGCELAHLEVIHDLQGRPQFAIQDSSVLQLFAEKIGTEHYFIHLSISHEDDYSVAFVVIEQGTR